MENENIREKYEEKIYRLMYNTERKNVSQREENIFNNNWTSNVALPDSMV